MNEKASTRIEQLTSALTRFDEVLTKPKDEFLRDSAIQRFEFTADLSWKVLQAALEERFGLRANSPKTAVRLAHENGMIADVSAWLAMIDDRNLTSHSYDQELAEEIYTHLKGYAKLARALLDSLRT